MNQPEKEQLNTAPPHSRRKSVREEMLRMLDGDQALQEQMLLAIRDKALSGDLKTIEFILNLIGEKPGNTPKDPDQGAVKIVLGPGVEEMAQ